MTLKRETSHTYGIERSSGKITLASEISVHELGELEYKTLTGKHGILPAGEWRHVAQKSAAAIDDMVYDGTLTEASRREWQTENDPLRSNDS